MEKHLEQVEAMIEENLAVPSKARSPWLDVALGALRTAAENLRGHLNPPKPATNAPAADAPAAE